MAGITNLTVTITDSIRWTASNSIVAQNPLTQGDNVQTNYGLGTANANGVSGGADELISFLQTIAAGASATINLQSITNILQQFGIPLARVKGYKMRLLAASGNGAVDTVNGTACTSVTVGNAGGAPCGLEMTSTTFTFNINNGGSHQHMDPSAAGFVQVTSGAKNILVVNNDGAHAAAFQLTLVGATT